MTEASWTVTLVAVTPQPFDPPTYIELDDLNHASVHVTDELVGPGTCETVAALTDLSDTAKLRLLDLWRAPCELWGWRDGERVFAGKVIAPSIGGGGASITLTAHGPLESLARMALDVDKFYSQIDQTLIVKDLIDLYQAHQDGHWGLDTTGLTASGVNRDLTYQAGMATLDRVFSEMGGRDGGFDLWVDPRDRRIYTRSPRRGNDLSSSVIVDGRAILDSSWAASIAPGQVATDVIAVASGPTGGRVIGRAADPALRAVAGRTTVVETFYDITEQSTIDAHAVQLVADLGTQVVATSTRLIPVDIPYGQVGAGDLVQFDHDFGLGLTSATRRIARLAVSVTSAGERLAVDFV